HLVVWELRNRPLVKSAAKGGFDFHGANNGLALPAEMHPRGWNHPRYNDRVIAGVDRLEIRRVAENWSDERTATELQKYADTLRTELQARILSDPTTKLP